MSDSLDWSSGPLGDALRRAHERLLAADEPERIKANREFYARQKAERKRRQDIARAINELERMTPAQQLAWVDAHPDLENALLGHLHPAAIAALMKAEAEETAKELHSNARPAKPWEWLAEALHDGRPHSATDVMRAANDAGIPARTLHRAKDRLRVRSLRRGFGPGATWYWQLARPAKSAGKNP